MKSLNVLLVPCVLILYQTGSTLASQTSSEKSVTEGPLNDAVDVSASSVMSLGCAAADSPPVSRVSWTEFITNANGAVISDNDFVLSGHPNSARYSIVVADNETRFDLRISPLLMQDGGKYRCTDVNDGSNPTFAQLITIESGVNCTSNIPDSGYVREFQYYTVECTVAYQGNVAPVMTWTGPESFLETSTTTNFSVWSGISVNMSRTMELQTFDMLANFTLAGFVQPNFATNIPTWNDTRSTAALIVQWEPKNMYMEPVQTSYEVGSEVRCHADANPPATFFWQKLETGERWYDYRLYASDALIGTQTMRCSALNNITGTQYTADLFFNFTVVPRTTTGAPTTSLTTTAPADGPCDDLSGRWNAYEPHFVDLCLEVNNTNMGRVIGLLRNDTDPYFIEIRGRVAPNNYAQIGFTGIWPVDIGTLSFAGICNKCDGEEQLWVNGVGRTTEDNVNCTADDSGDGAVTRIANYLFTRVGPPCR